MNNISEHISLLPQHLPQHSWRYFVNSIWTFIPELHWNQKDAEFLVLQIQDPLISMSDGSHIEVRRIIKDNQL